MPHDAAQIIETLRCGTEENQIEALRENQVINLPAEGDVWMTGDLHDHRRNFEKLLRHADLAHHPDRHLVLHELIHGDHYDAKGAEDSWEMLYRAASLKCDFPEQVHFLLANHDLAQIHGEGIMKAGLSVCEAFTAGVKRDFPGEGDSVNVAIIEFLLSFPLAIRAANGLWCSHSLPTDEQIPKFDYEVFNRPLVGSDYKRRTGPVYQLIWGRNISPAAAGEFADKVGAKVVVTGHQPQDMGYAINGERHIILASDHNQGVFVPIELSAPADLATITKRLRRFITLE